MPCARKTFLFLHIKSVAVIRHRKTGTQEGCVMPKARRRKGTPFETSLSKSVFLYGEPTKKKTAGLEKMQAGFLALVNQDIQMLHTQPGITRQLVKNDKKDSLMRSLEKQMREKVVNSNFCQYAIDMAFTHLSSRLDAIRL